MAVRTEAPTRNEALVSALQETARWLVGLTAKALASVGKDLPITLPQYRLLVLVAVRGECLPSELAEELGVTRPAVTRLLHGLSRMHLIERRVDPLDRRRTWLSVTPGGASIVKTVTRERERLLRPAVRRLSASDREMLHASLSRLLGAAARPQRRLGEKSPT
jgi:DNA-binding MarR family transcriptional regulator